MSLLGFLRDVGKHARVGTMLSRESVRSRMDADNEGMSFTECAAKRCALEITRGACWLCEGRSARILHSSLCADLCHVQKQRCIAACRRLGTQFEAHLSA